MFPRAARPFWLKGSALPGIGLPKATGFRLLCAALSAPFWLPCSAQVVSPAAQSSPAIRLLQPVEMSAGDANLVAASSESIARAAAVYGYSLDDSYSYRQIACPLATGYLWLAYERGRSTARGSRFTAVIPTPHSRSAAGSPEVQIVPIAHFGVIPFVPADSSPHSLEVFNQAAAIPAHNASAPVAGSHHDPLLLRSLCYAALVGGSTSILNPSALGPAALQVPMPTQQFLEGGAERQIFSAMDTGGEVQVWTMTYSRAGKIISAAQTGRTFRPATAAISKESAVVPSPASSTAFRPPPIAIQPAPRPTVIASLPRPPVAPPPTPGSSNQAAVRAIPSPAGKFIADPPAPPGRFTPAPEMPIPPVTTPK